MKYELIVGAALLCLPMTAEAARLISAPLTLDPAPLQTPSTGEGVREEITCSVHYSGTGTVNGVLIMTEGTQGLSSTNGVNTQVHLSPAFPNLHITGHRTGPEAIQDVVCEFSFPGVSAAKFRALSCITYEASHTGICVPAY